MGLEEEYPKYFRKRHGEWRSLTSKDSDCPAKERENIAVNLDGLMDKTLDLNEILHRLVDEQHSLSEIGELLVAVELTLEQIRGISDELDGKLYDIGDRLIALKPTETK